MSAVDEVMDRGAADADEIARLAALPPLERDRAVKESATKLGVTLSVVRAEVAMRAKASAPVTEAGSGSPLEIADPEPHHEAVVADALLDELATTVRHLVVMSEEAGTAAALWVAFSYTIDAFTFSPRLLVKSPEKRCGKTTLLDALTEVCRRPLPASNITAPALFRTIEKVRPSVVLDEADTFMRESEELRGLVNSGHRRSHAYVVRLVNVADDFEPRKFSTWCAMAIAGIGEQHGTIEDRSVIIELKRKMPGEAVKRLDAPMRRQLQGMARKLRRWADDNLDWLANADPATPASLHDRAADNWRPLLAIAEAAGGEWPEKAKNAALKLSGSDDADGLAAMLLEDVREVFAEKNNPTQIGSTELVTALVAMEHRPWPEVSRGKPLTTTKLAALLKRFRIGPKHTETGNGYLREHFADAWTRYLPQPEGYQPFRSSGIQETCGSWAAPNPSAQAKVNGPAEGLGRGQNPQKHWPAEDLKGSYPQAKGAAGWRAEL
jgi:putative DNA primase/helicase